MQDLGRIVVRSVREGAEHAGPVVDDVDFITVDPATAKGIPKVYVKVYARLADGTVKFHKDGYTDLRGRFDYTSVNTPERQPISRFAILAFSEEQGSLIQEASPPQQ
jgi:hypothetical protein